MSVVAKFCPICGSSLQGEPSCPTCGNTIPVGGYETFQRQSGGKNKRDPVLGVALSGWWRRVGAVVVDGICLVPIPILIRLVVHVGSITYFVGAVVSLVYLVGCWTLGNGQTLGNKAVRTAVRSATTGQKLNVLQALRRWLWYSLPTLVLQVIQYLGNARTLSWVSRHQFFYFHPTTTPKWVAMGTSHFLVLTLVIQGILAIDALWALGDSRKRTVHDILAKTIVVKL